MGLILKRKVIQINIKRVMGEAGEQKARTRTGQKAKNWNKDKPKVSVSLITMT